MATKRRSKPVKKPPVRKAPAALSAVEVRAIVREEVKVAMTVILTALLRAQPGQGGLDQGWVDVMMDENSSLHRLFFGPQAPVSDDLRFHCVSPVAEKVADTWHRCDQEEPPQEETLEISLPNAPCLVYAIKHGSRWYTPESRTAGLMTMLSDGLQNPVMWRRPTHQERRAA